MKSGTPKLRDVPRPIGMKVMSACLAIYGLQSLGGVIQLFPMWLNAARNHQFSSVPFIWVELALAITALTSAYGLWHHRRWARIPALAVAVLTVAVLLLISGFAIGDVGGHSTWLVVVFLLILALALSIWFVRYIWRNT